MLKYISFNLLKDKENIAVIKTENGYNYITCSNKTIAEMFKNIYGKSVIGYLQII